MLPSNLKIKDAFSAACYFYFHKFNYGATGVHVPCTIVNDLCCDKRFGLYDTYTIPGLTLVYF